MAAGGGGEGALQLQAPRGIVQGPGKTKPAKVMNKVAAAVQITAEQLLREARDRQEIEPPVPRQKLHDKEELIEYRIGKRKHFEDLLRKNKHLVSTWTKYAKWEEQQGEFVRARSLYERAMEVIPRNASIWQRYGEMEMRAGNLNMARNLWHRAVTLLPRVDVFWIKWAMMEQTAGDFGMCRQVFDMWMQTRPQAKAWKMYVKFELRLNELDRAREVVKRMVTLCNDVDSWLYYTKFEEQHGKAARCRRVWEESLEALGENADERVWLGFARFEERQREFDRARAIYRLALDRVPQGKAPALFQEYDRFEKRYGDREDVEKALHAKRRVEYEQSVEQAPQLYDTWVNYARLEEASADTGRAAEAAREVYERAIAQVPKIKEKHYWARYVYLWIMYAFFEELDMGDVDRARQVWETCIRVIPHKEFSFSKVWIFYAQFELRHAGIDKARSVLGRALGVHPRPKLFRFYIDLETQLGNADRVRRLYENWVKARPADGVVWTRFAEFEAALQEATRARALYELAVGQRVLDQPEAVWRKYIQFEVRNGAFDRVRELYRRLADKTRHVKVYMAWATFEAQTAADPGRARAVYEEADNELSQDPEGVEEWRLLLASWKGFEEKHGNAEQVSYVDAKINPEQKRKRHSKLLARVQAWKKQRTEQPAGAEGGGAAPPAADTGGGE
eukprot:TRINITY_DN14141_c0_g1_i1.p1 TRINITY_DN14141_c0_g1~~TRINITY_DN14141_c0_g1_i1.p1  ORF type:complete len:707 (+),score=241.32 TRINITY_DN14141_c0_g1_i1:90-2123(+)